MAGQYSTSRGVHDKRLLAVFAVTWLASAAKRVADFRRGHHQPLRIGAETQRASAVTLMLGVTPWILISLIYLVSPTLFLWSPLELPSWLKVVGLALAVTTIIRHPFRASEAATVAVSSNPFLPAMTPDTAALTLAIFLTSGSLVIAMMTCLWVAALCGTSLQSWYRVAQPIRVLSVATEQA